MIEAWLIIEGANWEKIFENYQDDLGDKIGSSMTRSSLEQALFDVFFDELERPVGHKVYQSGDDVKIDLWRFY